MIRRLWKDSRGFSAVETGLTLVLYIGILVSSCDMGVFFYMNHIVTERTRAAVHYGSLYPIDSLSMRNLVMYGTTTPVLNAQSSFGMKNSDIVISVCNANTSLARVTVAVNGINLQLPGPIVTENLRGPKIKFTLPVESVSFIDTSQIYSGNCSA